MARTSDAARLRLKLDLGVFTCETPQWSASSSTYVGVPGAGELIPPAALGQCAARGYGISTARRTVCIYMRTEGTLPGARIDEFAGEAQETAELLDA